MKIFYAAPGFFLFVCLFVLNALLCFIVRLPGRPPRRAWLAPSTMVADAAQGMPAPARAFPGVSRGTECPPGPL